MRAVMNERRGIPVLRNTRANTSESDFQYDWHGKNTVKLKAAALSVCNLCSASRTAPLNHAQTEGAVALAYDSKTPTPVAKSEFKKRPLSLLLPAHKLVNVYLDRIEAVR